MKNKFTNKQIKQIRNESEFHDFIISDSEDYEYIIDDLIKETEHYLVYLPHSTWNGASGCGIVNNKIDAFVRNYDFTQDVLAVSKGNKAVLLKEYHHDVPFGHHAVIIALTDTEYNKLENTDFKTMEIFAIKYLKALETNKKELYKSLI